MSPSRGSPITGALPGPLLRSPLLLMLALLPDAAQAGRHRASQTQDPCGLDQVYATSEALNGYRFEPGYGAGSTQAQALDDARHQASAALLDKLSCAQARPWSNDYCDAIRMNIDQWSGNVRLDGRKRWEACATAAIPEADLTQLQNAAAQLEVDMALLAARVADSAVGHPLGLMVPTWDSGCTAGDVGASLVQGLRRAFGQLDTAPQLLMGGGYAGGDGRRLLMRLGEQRGKVVVTASLISAGCTERPIGSIAFPSVLLDIPDGEAGRCATDPLLGTTSYGTCPGSLRVALDVPSQDGVNCPGQVISPVVRVNQPAHVQVYSVAEDGEAHLLFPLDGASDLVQDQVSLGEFDAIYVQGAGEERLVAVSVPAGSGFGLTKSWSGWCRVPGNWRTDLVPADAATTASNYLILAPGQSACEVGPTAPWQHSAAPRCGD